jgi:tRNA pseudouridine38-40 synthase
VSTLRRLRLDLAYDGSAYHGWARQDGLRPVQGEVEAALDTVLRTSGTSLTVAGRTDTGVHARGQGAHVDVDVEALGRAAGRSEGTPEDSLLRRLNGVLDPDLRIHRVRAAPEGFDARFGAVWRRYCYRIVDEPALVDPLSRGHVLAWPRRLDLDRMRKAAAPLLGEHDFAAFCRSRSGATTTRRLRSVGIRRVHGLVEVRLAADAFCWQMVRGIVGHLLLVGEGRRDPASTGDILAAADRSRAGNIAPPHGLVLEAVAYPRRGDRDGARGPS